MTFGANSPPTGLVWADLTTPPPQRTARLRPALRTLTDDAEVAYQMSAPYAPRAARGVRFDDPAFGIEWPGEVVVINERDRTYPDFAP